MHLDIFTFGWTSLCLTASAFKYIHSNKLIQWNLLGTEYTQANEHFKSENFHTHVSITN